MFGLVLRRARRFGRDERGSVAIMAAAFAVISAMLLAIGVDVAKSYIVKRQAQSAADLAAIAAAADIGNAQKAELANLRANGFQYPKGFVLTLGAYQADSKLDAPSRFRAGATPYNAVKVSFVAETPRIFGRAMAGSNPMAAKVSATGAIAQAAALSIGSRLASLNGGVTNALLSGLLGGSVNLSLMDYNALANVKLDALGFLDALAARVGVTAGTYDQLLGARVKATDLVRAIADVSQGNSTVKAGLAGIAAAIDATKLVDMRQMINLGPFAKLAIGNAKSVIGVGVSALDLLNVGAQVANGTRQVALDLGLQFPGLAGVTATIDIGERSQSTPWLVIGDRDVVVRTAQTRVRLLVQVGGTGSLLGQLVRLPIAIDVAAGQARLGSLSCGKTPQTDARLPIAALPAAAELWVGEPADPDAWAKGVGNPVMKTSTTINLLNLTTATVYAHTALTNVSEQTLSFSYADVQNLATKSVKTTSAVQTALASLTSSLTIKLTLLGADVTLLNGALSGLLSSILTPVGALLDPVVNALLDLLGVSIGEADVQVRGLKCSGGALVN